MDRVVRLNVVDEPVSWRAFPSDPWKRKKAGHLGLRSPLCEPAGGGLLKTMPVYGDDSPYVHHTSIFGKMPSHLPAVLFSRILAWSRVRDSST